MLRTLFFILILVPGLVAVLFSRFSALLLYLWLAMFRPQDWLWIDISQFRLSLVVGLALVVPCLFTGILPSVLHPLAIGSLLFLVASAVAQMGAVRPDIGLQWMDYLARLLLVGLLIAPLAKTPRRILLVVGVLSGSLVFYSAKAGLGSAFGGGSRYFSGLAGSFVDSNGYAVGTAMAMFLFLAVGQNVPWRIPRWAIFTAAGPLSAMTIISLFSRAGLLALVAGTLTFVLLQRWLRAGAALLIVIVCAVLLRTTLPAGYTERVAPLMSYSTLTTDRSAASRLHFWGVAIDMAAARPFGVGLRNFEYAYDQFDSSNGAFGHNRAVHNSPLQVLSETGFIGLAAYAFVMIWSFRLLFAIRRRSNDARLSPEIRQLAFTLANGMVASMVAFQVGGMFLSLALNDLTWFTVGCVIALDRLTTANVVSAVSSTTSVLANAMVPAGARNVRGARG